jgi:hypothetical protein
MSTREEWRDVVGFEGRYNVSDRGRVQSLCPAGHKSGGLLRPQTTERGYLRVCLYLENGLRKFRKVHQLVCEAFNGPKPEGDFTVDHRDNRKKNNRRHNLRWMTRLDNWERWFYNDDSPAPF